jgi:DNA-binding winged helix-turn-helix (wHTH) protein
MDRIMMNREIVLNGRWRLDAVESRLVDLQDGVAGTVLSPIAVRLLTLLAGSPNTVIGRRKLFDEGWRQFGFEVCDNSLNQVIHALREAFRNAGAGAPAIKTVPRIGYCLMARVTMREAGGAVAAVMPVTDGLRERRLLDREVFDGIVEREWGGAPRGERPLSLLMVRCAASAGASADDTDASGSTVQAILGQIHRAGDVAACYASDGTITVYAVLLPVTDGQGAAMVGRKIEAAANGQVLAVGLACMAGQQYATPEELVEAARAALDDIPDGMSGAPLPLRPELSLAA